MEEEVPLRQYPESFPVKPEAKKGGATRWRDKIVNKRTIIIAAIVILVLTILVNVLGGLLLAEQAKRKALEEQDDGDKGSAAATTSAPGPTTPGTEAPGPTTPGTEVWRNVRLPENIVPVHYDVVLYIDLKKLEFHGDVAILVHVTESTENVLVHVNKMNITSVSVEKAAGGDPLEIQQHFWFEKNQFYVIVLRSALEKGQYHIKMKFNAWLDDGLGGLYKSTYKRKDGKEVTIAATQFQPTDARRAFPCFDEPALKATFTVTLAHDPSYISISNMPIESSDTKEGWKFDRFQKTPKMPTYLLAFVVCDFDNRASTTKLGTKMTFYAAPDLIDQIEYAKENAVKMLDYMEQYFNIPYPLPKADMIALPDFAANGMGNWGLLLYQEAALLYKPNASSEADKQRTAAILSHALAHQWFGNLVTMSWWEELWLNEGFASYVEYYGMNATEPGWKVMDQFVVIDHTAAFTLDGLANSHPIKVPVNHPDEIYEIFDSISYEKGASIIRMLEFFLGKDVFQKGLTRYLNKHKFGNAVTDDLWSSLEKESCAQKNCKSVKQMMDTWTLQMNYPVLHITKKDGNKYTVSQERFLYDRNANVRSKYKSPFNYKWVVPFTYITKADPKPTSKPLNITSAEIDWDGTGWLKGNAGQTGFYRVNYEQKQWDQLTNQLDTDHKVFEVTDRAGMIDDAFNLARAGYIKYTVPLNITKYIRKEEEYVPWAAVKNNMEYMTSILQPYSSSAYKYLKKYLQHQATTQYQKLGFKDSGSHLDVYKRSLVLSFMCSAGEPSCLKNASEYYKKWMEDPQKYPVPANLRSLVYFYGIKNGGEKEWDFAFEQFHKSTVPSERKQFLMGLAGASEPWILRRYLEYSRNPEKIRMQDSVHVLINVANQNTYGRQLTWQFIKLNWDFIMNKFGRKFFAMRKIILAVTEGFATEFELQDLRNFNKKNPAGSGARAQEQAEETVKANIQWRKDNEQDIENWLKDYLKANNIPLN